jgi:predicted peroxiredoxin
LYKTVDVTDLVSKAFGDGIKAAGSLVNRTEVPRIKPNLAKIMRVLAEAGVEFTNDDASGMRLPRRKDGLLS